MCSQHDRCSAEILTVAAMLSVPNPFLRPRDKVREADERKNEFAKEDGALCSQIGLITMWDDLGDHLKLLEVFNQFVKKDEENQRHWCYSNFLNFRSLKSAENVRTQLFRICQKMGIKIISDPSATQRDNEHIRWSLLIVLFRYSLFDLKESDN